MDKTSQLFQIMFANKMIKASKNPVKFINPLPVHQTSTQYMTHLIMSAAWVSNNRTDFEVRKILNEKRTSKGQKKVFISNFLK